MGKVYKVGLIGCGHIAETYFRAHKYFNNFKIIKCADINKFAAQKCAKTYKISSTSVNELLKDKENFTRDLGGNASTSKITENLIKILNKII